MSAPQQQQQQAQGHLGSRPDRNQPEEVIAASVFSQQLIEQKERELQEFIAVNYTRIRDVEKELRGLQRQVKLTADPKKQALEMLRKKIEVQNNKVLAVRRCYEVAKQTYEQLQSELDHEESLKQQLCDELNQLVTTSVSSQLERFEQLKVALEALQGGTGAMARCSSAPTQYAPAAGAGPVQAVAAQTAAAHKQQQQAGPDTGAGAQLEDMQQQQQQPEQSHPQLPVSTHAGAPGDAQAADQARAAAAAAEAAAARSRHVQLPGRLHGAGPAASNPGGVLQQGHGGAQHTGQHPGSLKQPERSSHATRDREGRFAGFE